VAIFERDVRLILVSPMPFDPVSLISGSLVAASVKPAVDGLKAVIRTIRRQHGDRKAKQITSSVIAELLKESPDVTAAEARLAAVEATGVQPTVEFHQAKQMLGAVRRRKASTVKARWAARRRVAARKKTSGKKVSKIKVKRLHKTVSRVKRR
jgi:hypothetical protein